MEAALSRSLTELPSRLALELGATYGLAAVGEWRWETLVTACFLHAGVLHLACNMFALWQGGPLVERAVGAERFVAVYLAAGVFGNLVYVASDWVERTGTYSVGASGAISGLFAAALVVGWRTQGWSGPLTQTMAGWLGFVIVFGLLSSHSANSAHIGGAVAGGVIAALWRARARPSARVTAAVVGGCTTVLLASIALVAVRDRTDPFATMMLPERSEFTHDALADGRCGDAHAGLAAVERLRLSMAPVTSLRKHVEGACGHDVPRGPP
jgi:rhomboid protease GluP